MAASDLLPEYGTLARLIVLRDLLVAQECDKQTIFEQLSDFYPNKAASTKKLSRDLQSLQAFGYVLETQRRPLRWRITPSLVLTETDIQTLRIIHEAFGERHPFSEQCRQFVRKLTQNLTPAQQRAWNRSVFAANDLVPVRNYAPHAPVISTLNQAIEQRRQVRFLYTAKEGMKIWHTIDPYQIELRDRQYYLEAYSYAAGYVLIFRIDRIELDTNVGSPEVLPSMQSLPRQRRPIHFVYRLSHALAAGGVSARFTIDRTEHTPEGVLVYASDPNEIHIVRTLLSYGEHAVLIHGPPSVFERLRREILRLYENHML